MGLCGLERMPGKTNCSLKMGSITAFGEDEQGQVCLVDHGRTVFRLANHERIRLPRNLFFYCWPGGCVSLSLPVVRYRRHLTASGGQPISARRDIIHVAGRNSDASTVVPHLIRRQLNRD
jgi:hypothetical protein